jgi:hypothetical protein
MEESGGKGFMRIGCRGEMLPDGWSEELDDLRSQYHQRPAAKLPQLLDSSLHEKLTAHDPYLDGALTMHALHFVANGPLFLGAVREITGEEDIGAFCGEIVRFENVNCRPLRPKDVPESPLAELVLILSADSGGQVRFRLSEATSDHGSSECCDLSVGDAVLIPRGPSGGRVEIGAGNCAATGLALVGSFLPARLNYHQLVHNRIPLRTVSDVWVRSAEPPIQRLSDAIAREAGGTRSADAVRSESNPR